MFLILIASQIVNFKMSEDVIWRRGSYQCGGETLVPVVKHSVSNSMESSQLGRQTSADRPTSHIFLSSRVPQQCVRKHYDMTRKFCYRSLALRFSSSVCFSAPELQCSLIGILLTVPWFQLLPGGLMDGLEKANNFRPVRLRRFERKWGHGKVLDSFTNLNLGCFWTSWYVLFACYVYPPHKRSTSLLLVWFSHLSHDLYMFLTSILPTLIQ